MSSHTLRRSRAAVTSKYPASTRKTTNEYILASVAYRSAHGLSARTTTASHATGLPPTRRPANHISGNAATAKTPESARTTRSVSPNTDIQPCRRK